MSRHYTNAPAPTNEDYQLPYFLKDDEKYVELMAAVHELLRTYPEFSEPTQWARLNEAYHQVKGHPHPYESIPATRGINSSLHPSSVPSWVHPYQCIWCGVDFTNHR